MKSVGIILQDLMLELDKLHAPFIRVDVTFPTEFIFVHSLERLRRNLRTISLLINKDPIENEHGIGLSIRNILTDLFTIAYLRDYSNDIEELTTNAYNLFYQDIDLILKVARTQSEIGQLPQEAYKNHLNIIETEGNLLNKIKTESKGKFPKTSEIYNKYYSKDTNKELHSTITNAYDMWLYFSKYEHIGWYSYEITRTPLGYNKFEKVILTALGYTIISAKISAEKLKKEEAFEKLDKLQILITEFLRENK